MAIITPSLAISEIRGSVGDLTFSRNRYRAYTKARVTPANPNTLPQQDIRSFFSQASQYWSQLSLNDRTAWNQIAKDQSSKSRLGTQPKMTGFNAYMRSYFYNQLDCSVYSETPLIGKPIPNPTSIVFDASTSAITFDCNMTTPAQGLGYVFFMSTPVSVGIMSHNSVTFKMIEHGNTTDSFLSFDLLSAYEALFNIDIFDWEDEQIFWKLKFVDYKTGENRFVAVGSGLINA